MDSILITDGQLDYEYRILMERLKKRAPQAYTRNLGTEKILSHPLFRVYSGLPEKWEISYWRIKTN